MSQEPSVVGLLVSVSVSSLCEPINYIANVGSILKWCEKSHFVFDRRDGNGGD